ncbi:MAG: outer-membrane lipoprotein carrier protein LolA [Candidatus Sumerlaea chitinivorans]|nr:outer-membrane lipoprotein carrier protein LolA [Candidatus Sumerlaea chitinivorans]
MKSGIPSTSSISNHWTLLSRAQKYALIWILTVSAALLPPLASADPSEATETTTPPTKSTTRVLRHDTKSETQAVQILRQLETKYAQILTVTGKFRQVTVDSTFGEKIESAGKFYLKKPDRFRADYDPPHATTTIIADGYSYRYVPQLKQVERYRIPTDQPITQLNYMLLGFGARTEDILKVYRVALAEKTPDTKLTTVELTPIEAESAPFRMLRMRLSSKDLIPVEFEVVQWDEGVIRATLDLASLQFNADIPDTTFMPRFPRDAQIVDIR